MITDEKISDIVKGIVMLLTNLITEPMTELTNMVETIKATTDRLTADMLEMHSEIESKINLAISNIETCPEIEQNILDIEDKIQDLEYKIEEVEDSRVDNESNIEDNESNIEEIVSKLGLIGDILNE